MSSDFSPAAREFISAEIDDGAIPRIYFPAHFNLKFAEANRIQAKYSHAEGIAFHPRSEASFPGRAIPTRTNADASDWK
jgi:hypothetical protein